MAKLLRGRGGGDETPALRKRKRCRKNARAAERGGLWARWKGEGGALAPSDATTSANPTRGKQGPTNFMPSYDAIRLHARHWYLK